MKKYFGYYGLTFEDAQPVVFVAEGDHEADKMLHEMAIEEYQCAEGHKDYLDWYQVAEREGVDFTEAAQNELNWVDNRYNEEIEDNITWAFIPFEDNNPLHVETLSAQEGIFWGE